MLQWDTWDPEQGYEKTTPTETEYRKITEEPHPDVDDIGSFDKYISVTVKLDNENYGGGNIANQKCCATHENGLAIGYGHNNPLLDT